MNDHNQSYAEDSTSHVDPTGNEAQAALPPGDPLAGDGTRVAESSERELTTPELLPDLPSTAPTPRFAENADDHDTATEVSPTMDLTAGSWLHAGAKDGADESATNEPVLVVNPEPQPDPESELDSQAGLNAGDALVLAASRKHIQDGAFLLEE